MKKFYSTTIVFLIFFLAPHITHADFIDVPKNHSKYNDIQYLLEKGVITESPLFGVNETVSREEVAVMIAKATGLDGAPRFTDFYDISSSNENSGYIQSAAENGIIKGFEDGEFKPDNKVTRGHVATFISRAFDLPKGSKTFKDVKKGQTAYDAVSQLAAAGITTGYEDNTFRPNEHLTRGHVSAFLARAMKNYEVKSTIVPKVTVTEDRLWSYLDAPYDFKGDLRVRLVDVYLTSEFLRIIVDYHNDGVSGGGIYNASTKVNNQDVYDSSFNFKMKDKYGGKSAPVTINFLDGTITDYQYFKPTVVEGDKATFTFSFGGKYFTFEDVEIRK